MASSTTTRKPANADRDALAAGHSERMHGDHARQAPENRPTADNPTGAAGVTFTFGAAVVSAGLVAGLFFFNSSVVMPALAELDDRTFVEVLDKINDAVYNPLFFAVTFGAPLLIAVAAVQQRPGENRGAARWTWAALALYVAGLMVTLGVNVPLTDDLVAAEPSNASEFAAVREDFEGPFNAADIVRTILHTAAIACLAVVPSRALRTP
jgi:uncharacterized membrane protein